MILSNNKLWICSLIYGVIFLNFLLVNSGVGWVSHLLKYRIPCGQIRINSAQVNKRLNIAALRILILKFHQSSGTESF